MSASIIIIIIIIIITGSAQMTVTYPQKGAASLRCGKELRRDTILLTLVILIIVIMMIIIISRSKSKRVTVPS